MISQNRNINCDENCDTYQCELQYYRNLHDLMPLMLIFTILSPSSHRREARDLSFCISQHFPLRRYNTRRAIQCLRSRRDSAGHYLPLSGRWTFDFKSDRRSTPLNDAHPTPPPTCSGCEASARIRATAAAVITFTGSTCKLENDVLHARTRSVVLA